MWSGSANFTQNGLTAGGNEEQLVRSDDSDDLSKACKFFDHAMSLARDLLDEVLKCLEEWRDMATPFQAYLKALECIFNRPEPELGKGGMVPTYFQEGVIVRAVQSLSKQDGCLILVGTGLGKTVIGAETIRRLGRSAFGLSVIVIAPKNVVESWETQLVSRQVNYCQFFDSSLLFRTPPSDEIENEISRLEEAIATSDDKTIVLVDESQKYRGILQKEASLDRLNIRLPDEQKHHCHLRERFQQVIERKSKIILLTATPFGTSKQDINSLLSLLPPAPASTSASEATWKIRKLKETASLPPVTVLGIYDVLQMAGERGDVEPNGRLYISMPNGTHKYFPKQLESRIVEFDPPLCQEFADAYDKQAFTGKDIHYERYDDEEDKSRVGITNAAENNAVTSWLSSLAALKRLVKDYREKPAPNHPETSKQRTLQEKQLNWDKRRELLEPLWDALQTCTANQDHKLAQLLNLLGPHIKEKHKIIIFVRRYSTACYLDEQLCQLLPGVAVGCTVREQEKPQLKPFAMREHVIKRFAPIANDYKNKNCSYFQILTHRSLIFLSSMPNLG